MRRRGRSEALGLLGLCAAAVSCSVNDQRVITEVQPGRPSFAITSPTQVSCDIDVVVSASGTSGAQGSEDVSSFNAHISASRVNGVTAVTATVDQLPGATIDLLRPSLTSPVAAAASDTMSPARPNAAALRVPTQASLDSLAALPLDVFCHVVRQGGSPTLSPSAVGTMGTLTTSAQYAGGVAATTTIDQSSGLRLRETVTINGVTVRDTRFEYSSDGSAVYRARTTSDESMYVNGTAFFQRSEIVTRNVTRTFGGI